VVATEVIVDTQVVVVVTIQQVVDADVGLQPLIAPYQSPAQARVGYRIAGHTVAVGIVRVLLVEGVDVDPRIPVVTLIPDLGEQTLPWNPRNAVAVVALELVETIAVVAPGSGQSPIAPRQPVPAELETIAAGAAGVGIKGTPVDYRDQFVLDAHAVEHRFITQSRVLALQAYLAVYRPRRAERWVEAAPAWIGHFVDRRRLERCRVTHVRHMTGVQLPAQAQAVVPVLQVALPRGI